MNNVQINAYTFFCAGNYICNIAKVTRSHSALIGYLCRGVFMSINDNLEISHVSAVTVYIRLYRDLIATELKSFGESRKGHNRVVQLMLCHQFSPYFSKSYFQCLYRFDFIFFVCFSLSFLFIVLRVVVESELCRFKVK